MISIRVLDLLESKSKLTTLPEGKLLINTINAYSYNNARHDELFEEALMKGDVLIPDGISIVHACRFLHYVKTRPKERIAGWDLFAFEMKKLNGAVYDATQTESDNEMPFWKKMNPDRQKPVVMFIGSSKRVLDSIVENAAYFYPNLEVKTYSPPFKPIFTVEDNRNIVNAINAIDPDLLWIGMTAPKQEKWTYSQWDKLNIHCHVGTIGAVFDFFAGTRKRAPKVMQNTGFEWLYRLLSEPKRMWRRYIIGNVEFVIYILREKLGF